MHTTNLGRLSVTIAFAAISVLAATDTKNEPGTTPVTIGVQSGTATFVANTNVTAISIKGKSTALVATVSMRRLAQGLHLDHIEAHMPVKTLMTGMGLRDEHMRKYIFTTSDGKVPDLTFEGGDASCTGSGKDATCQVMGNLAIRGVAKPFTMPLKVKEDGAGFKASGDATVKLSAYGIEQPSQFGVKTTDEVQLHFEFAAKPVAGPVAMLGAAK